MIVGDGRDSNQRAIYMTGGTLELNGGYICNFDASHTYGCGAAVWSSGGTIALTNTVIAANKASNGGAIAVKGATLNIGGGAIAGNIASGTKNEGRLIPNKTAHGSLRELFLF